MNSGSSRSKVSDYIKKNRIAIPVIADVDRTMEGSANLPAEISLKNIWQARVILPDGSLVRGSASDLEASMNKAAEGAAWNLDPAEFPDSMKPLWQLVEFGNYTSAAKGLKRKLGSRNKTDKAAAKKLSEYVEEQLRSAVTAAEAKVEENKWLAWKQFNAIEQRFAGYSVPRSVETSLDKLADTDEVKDQLAAMKLLEQAKRMASRGGWSKQRAVAALKKLVESYPDTEAAVTARAYLEDAGQ